MEIRLARCTGLRMQCQGVRNAAHCIYLHGLCVPCSRNACPTGLTGPSSGGNRRFPEIKGKDNLTVCSYSGRVKSPEWRRQLRRADLRQF